MCDCKAEKPIEPTGYNEAKTALGSCSREKLSKIILEKAGSFRYEADKLVQLSKTIDILPEEIQNVLYPIIIDYLYHSNRT